MTEKCDTCEEDLNPYDQGVYRLDTVNEVWSRKGEHSLMPRIHRTVPTPKPLPQYRHGACMNKEFA